MRGPGPGSMRGAGPSRSAAPMERHMQRPQQRAMPRQQPNVRRAEPNRQGRPNVTQRPQAGPQMRRDAHQGRPDAQRPNQAAQRPGGDRPTAERNGDRSTAGRGDERRPNGERGEDRRNTADRNPVARHEEFQRARENLAPDNRNRLRNAFDFDRARIHRAGFDHRIGHRISRDIRLWAIPAAVFGYFPYYEGYSYFVAGDDLCIVDPRTYTVVDVVERTYWNTGRPQVAGLNLTGQEIVLVRESIPPDYPDAGLNLRLALGATIPRDAQLDEFPAILLDRIPRLAEYRFVVDRDQIVIVRPADREIAMVIDRRP
ncbi:MAG: DUF1236 domain-containing protein [Hyphomicrobiales bacterium]|nr:MAG: DUF1236 domain-containing protein [Hyphomicrobiales bacterium]